MLQVADSERLGNKEEPKGGMPGFPWEGKIEEISWVDWGQVGEGNCMIRLGGG